MFRGVMCLVSPATQDASVQGSRRFNDDRQLENQPPASFSKLLKADGHRVRESYSHPTKRRRRARQQGDGWRMDEESERLGVGTSGGASINNSSELLSLGNSFQSQTQSDNALVEEPSHAGPPGQLDGLTTSLPLGDGDGKPQQHTHSRIGDDHGGDAVQPAPRTADSGAHEEPPPLLDGNTHDQSFEGFPQQAGELQSHYSEQQQQHPHHLHLHQLIAPQAPSAPPSQQAPQIQFAPQTSAPAQHPLIGAANGAVHALVPPQHQHQYQQQPQSLPQNLIPHFQSPHLGLGSQQSTPPSPRQDGHFANMKLIPDPPDLQKWREKLFNAEDTIILSEEDFQTYFPHVDNVYSHRSTQRYKRKPFVSHYWDCRLKGRPPGTPKSHDPNKKKRKRVARERNLCDVKIKITEHFPGSFAEAAGSGAVPSPSPSSGGGLHAELEAFSSQQHQHQQNTFAHDGLPGAVQPFGVLTPSAALPADHPGAGGARYYTIQRVNGNGGNGRADSVGGPHRHTLEESDRVKKNSVQRHYMKEQKEEKKVSKNQTQQKSYHKKASGYAFSTVQKHAKESDLKLYGSCFCPFVQRVWIALEVKGIPYQYIEIDPYKKPESLLEVNPRGLVPAVRHGNWGCHESTVLLEYLEDLDAGNPLLPPGDPQLRAHCRLWADHINRYIIPCFYRLLQEQDLQKQIDATEELKDGISKLVNASHVHGPFFLGPSISFVDIQFAPWMLRLSRVLKPYRGWPDPERGSRWAAWVEAVETNDQVMATTSTNELYLDSYQRYADNRPGTSMLANAINSGRPLP